MFGYYLELAARSSKSTAALTALTILAVGVGIGASMTVFTLFRALSGDPIPQKSAHLFVPFIDNWGPNASIPEIWRSQLSYMDATALMRARRASRQAAMYATSTTITPNSATATPFIAIGRATDADFFQMFDVPFQAGVPWSTADDHESPPIVVLTRKFAERLFPSGHAVGHEVVIDQHPYRVVGVLKEWNPQPHFYDLGAQPEDFFLPFSTAIDRQMRGMSLACNTPAAPGWSGLLSSECIWISFWVELNTSSDAEAYGRFLHNYAASQQDIGRFNWPPRFALYSLREWLTRQQVVPKEIRVASFAAFGFLAVCLMNAISLLLAKFTGRRAQVSLHQALGASRGDIFAQHLTETVLIGVGGGLLGLLLTWLGLILERAILGGDLASLAQLDSGMVLITMGLAAFATLACGVYPSWRASNVPPAWQLKAL